MSRSRVVVLLSLFMLIALPIVGGMDANAPQDPAFVPGEILLKFKSTAVATDSARLASELGATQIQAFSSNAVHWRLAPEVDVLQAVSQLKSDPAVLYAVADRLAQPAGKWRPFDRSGGVRSWVYRNPRRRGWF